MGSLRRYTSLFTRFWTDVRSGKSLVCSHSFGGRVRHWFGYLSLYHEALILLDLFPPTCRQQGLIPQYTPPFCMCENDRESRHTAVSRRRHDITCAEGSYSASILQNHCLSRVEQPGLLFGWLTKHICPTGQTEFATGFVLATMAAILRSPIASTRGGSLLTSHPQLSSSFPLAWASQIEPCMVSVNFQGF